VALIVALCFTLGALLAGCGGGGGDDDSVTPIGDPPDAPGNVTGTVKTAQGAGIADATVTISTSPAEQTTTSSDGAYGFWVPPGTYTVRAEKTGYQPAEVPVTLLLGETATADIVLSP
jgi:hypothetical protein